MVGVTTTCGTVVVGQRVRKLRTTDNHSSLFHLSELPILDISYEWNHSICDSVCLLLYYIFKTHLQYDMYQYSFMSRFCFLKYKYHNLLTHACMDAWSISHLSIENCYEGTYMWLPIFNPLGYVLDKNHRIITILCFSLKNVPAFPQIHHLKHH